ncbi:Endonuclease/exonuclease/phosphatase, partial [Xylariaceae sp. FL0594]
MQEPWVGIPPHRRMAVKTHPNYNIFSPVDSWDSDRTRPRSLIYVRKHLRADQLRPYQTRDITWVKVRGITFASVYRPSDNPRTVDEILAAWTPPFGCVVAGDFNAGDSSWDANNPDYHGGAALAGIMHEHGLDLISEPDVPTHDEGNVLDLAFSDVPMAEAMTNEALQSTSDHETLRIVVPITKDLTHRPKSKKWIVPEDRLPELADIVKHRIHELPSLGSSTEELDRFAQALVDVIQGAVKIAGKKPSRFRINV